MLIRGTDLTPAQRRTVLAAFIYRWTTGNTQRAQAYGRCPKCDIREPYVNPVSAEGHNHPTLPLATDEEWLQSHAFHFTQDGKRLMQNRTHAEPIFMARAVAPGQHGQEVLAREGVRGRLGR